jgi:hypothetical protein
MDCSCPRSHYGAMILATSGVQLSTTINSSSKLSAEHNVASGATSVSFA